MAVYLRNPTRNLLSLVLCQAYPLQGEGIRIYLSAASPGRATGLNPTLTPKSGMRRLALKVDSKGRIQIPKEIREELGIGNEVSASIQDGIVTIEPVEHIFDRLSREVRFNFKGVEESMPKLRRAAEEELSKQIL